MQRKMMMLMPIMFTFFMMNMPSGLVIYWLTSNVLGARQCLTNKKADQLDAEAKAQGTAQRRRVHDGQSA
jgi:membrane protein insertase Oxa1/YidC/SpoIIIJ